MDDKSPRPAWYLPSVADLLFLAIVLRALQLGRSDLLNDPGTPWHVQVGFDVWQSGPPRHDTFSFTRAGEPWISQHWLCDAGFAVLYRHWSWNGLVAVAALLLGWSYRSLFRTVLDAGANVAWSAVLTLLAAGCGAGHWLARPHLWSLLFFVLTVRWCFEYGRGASRSIWALPGLMLTWANLHGAFLAGLVVVGCSIVALAFDAPRDAAWRRRLREFVFVFLVASLATFVNPYGWRLHAQLGKIMFTSQVRDLIDEWRAPDFQAADSRPLEALLLLAVVLLAIGRPRPRLASLLHLVVWVHFGLGAVRQVAFLGVIAAPILAGLTSDLGEQLREQLGLTRWPAWIADLGRRARDWTTVERAAGWPMWSIAASGLLVAATALHVVAPAIGIGAAQLSPSRFPIAAVERLNSEPDAGPLFHDLNWGGYLILNAQPRRVFADDRFELYGREFVRKYLDALGGGPAWPELLGRYHFSHVLIRADAPLAGQLRESGDWETIHADGTAVLLCHRPGE